uniref:uncharacterized protein LOC112436479 n=1 Tax=Maylandia zebra TaxID=106582 RepID=UPI000D30ED97|nr:uncharacterized protein LOC112436479 [Maylandia zebra]
MGTIQGGWFKGAKALQSLTLEGNLLTSLDSRSFPLNDLRELRNLDLSDNLIEHVERNSFRGLVSLTTLDLSRNRLSSAPVDAFSYLTWLTNLNLDLNSWNCSCQLLELADFLSTFIQQPDKILYNGRRMVCASADNPAVTTVLELTDANCVPSNQNITVHIEPRASVTPQLYARDLAITAVICFIERGGRNKRQRKRREKRQKVQSSRLVKVKLNLNPLRKSKVHPRKKNEQGPLEKSSSKKSKEKRKDGKEREEKEEKGKSSKKKIGKSSKIETSAEVGIKEEEVRGEEGQKSQTPSEKTTSKSDNNDQKSTEDSRYPENNQSVQSSSAADQSGSTIVSGHGQSLLGNKYQGTGLTLGSAQHSSTNLSLLGSAGSQLSGSSLSLPGGNFLLSTLASGSNLLFPRGPAPSIAFSGPNVAPSSAPDMLIREAAGGVLSAANPLHASATPQTGGAPLNLAANPGVNPAVVQSPSQSQMLPDSAPLVAMPKPELVQGQVIAPKRLEPTSTVENISISNSQAETGNVSVGTIADISVGGVAQTEVPAVERSGASMQEAGVSGVPGISTESESSTAAALLQQEYLPEEGGSPSLRRKLRLVLPEKTSSRPLTALERKIR